MRAYGCWAEGESWLRREAVPRTASVGFSLAEMQPLHWGGKEKQKKERKNPRRKNQLLSRGSSFVNRPSHATRSERPSRHAARSGALTPEQIPGSCCLSRRMHLILSKTIITVIPPAETRELLDECHLTGGRTVKTPRDSQLQLSPGIVR